MSHIAIWKYYDEKMRYYFNDSATVNYHPTYVDRIKINSVVEFPTFSIKAENRGGLLEYTAGEFRVRLSYLQTETSVNGDTIKDFLFPDTKPCKFLCQVYINDDCHFAGFFTSADLTEALTFNKNDYYIDIKVTGALREFADSYSQYNQGTRVFGGESIWTFEAYIPFHFDDHTTWSLELPATTYRSRVGNAFVGFNTRLQYLVDINGGSFSNIPRWETFQELRKGLGFDCLLQFEQPDQFITERPDFKLKLFWLTDLTDEQSVDINILSHDVEYVLNSKPYLFIPTRYATIPYAGFGDKDTYQGIIFNNTDSISISYFESAFSPAQNIAGFVEETNGNDFIPKNSLLFKDPSSVSGYSQPQYWNMNSDIQKIDFTYHSYNSTIYDSQFMRGGMTYAYFFTDGFGGRHLSSQAYLINIYRRYLMGVKEIKTMQVRFTGNEGLDLYKKLTLEGKDFYISEINGIDLWNKTAEIKAIEL